MPFLRFFKEFSLDLAVINWKNMHVTRVQVVGSAKKVGLQCNSRLCQASTENEGKKFLKKQNLGKLLKKLCNSSLDLRLSLSPDIVYD